MSPRLVVLILAVLAAKSLAAEPSIKIGWRICELTGNTRLPKNAARLLRDPKVDMVRPPPFTVVTGQVGEASVARDLGVAGKGGMQVGVFLTIRPMLTGKQLSYSVDSKRVEFIGRRSGGRGVFEIRKITGMRGSCQSGVPVVLDLGVREDRRRLWSGDDDQERTAVVKRRLIAILTFAKA